MHMIKKEQIDLRESVCPKSERIHRSIVWDCSISTVPLGIYAFYSLLFYLCTKT